MNWKLGFFISILIIFVTQNASADNLQIKITKGSSVKGCQNTFTCFQPHDLEASVGDTITWTNEDNEIHLVVSGSPQSGPDGWFGSQLIYPGKTFSYTVSREGPFPFFDILHPWNTGLIVIQKDKQNYNFYNEQVQFWKKMGWQ